MGIEGGFVLKTKKEISNLIDLLASKTLPLSEARVVLASTEMRSIRDAAEALRSKNKKGSSVIPDFKDQELKQLTLLPLKKIKAAKKRLLKNEFPLFAKNGGELPIPRRLVRFLAKLEKRSTFLVLMAYIERGLTLRNREVKSAGTMKASQIVSRAGLSLRAVRIARAELLSLEIITPDTTRFQRKLNRDGAYFTVNLRWSEKKVINREGSEGTFKDPAAERVPVDNFFVQKPKIAPLTPQKAPQNAPPYRDKISSYEFRNQKTAQTPQRSSGVFSKQIKRRGGGPTIFDVQREDLEQFSRCRVLYSQACKRGIIKESEANFLNFIAAAVRAKSAKDGDPVRIFMGIVRNNLWMNITQAEEERARAAVKKYQHT